MLYRHDIDNCFSDAIGDMGLDESSYGSALAETETALEALREAHTDNSLPLLRLPEAREDLELLKPIVEKFRRDFDHVVVLGTGGKALTVSGDMDRPYVKPGFVIPERDAAVPIE